MIKALRENSSPFALRYDQTLIETVFETMLTAVHIPI
jgi:hypothetical protein